MRDTRKGHSRGVALPLCGYRGWVGSHAHPLRSVSRVARYSGTPSWTPYLNQRRICVHDVNVRGVGSGGRVTTRVTTFVLTDTDTDTETGTEARTPPAAGGGPAVGGAGCRGGGALVCPVPTRPEPEQPVSSSSAAVVTEKVRRRVMRLSVGEPVDQVSNEDHARCLSPGLTSQPRRG